MINLLDHGYLELVETWGSDERIIEAARMSTGKGFLGWGPFCGECGAQKEMSEEFCKNGCGRIEKSGDEKLLRYLWEHEHATPFEMAGATFEVKAPIMVFREWHRHRVPFGYNEMSARYTPLPNENYVPTLGSVVDRASKARASKNKQEQARVYGKHGPISDQAIESWLRDVENCYAAVQALYERGLDYGVPKEVARIILPVGRYSRMRATSNLRGWLAFLKLRAALTAQYEIRVYAEAIQTVLAERFPRTLELFAEGQKRP